MGVYVRRLQLKDETLMQNRVRERERVNHLEIKILCMRLMGKERKKESERER